MKKTLITLAALATSVACADTVINDTYTLADFEGNVLTLKHDLTNNIDWTLDVTVTIGTEGYNDWGTTIIAGSSDMFTYVSGGDGDFAGSFQVWRAVGADGRTDIKLNSGSASDTHPTWTVGETYTFTIAYTAEDKGLSITGEGIDLSTTLSNPATFTQLSSGAVGKAGWDVTIKHTAVVPEPTTATLSLLALAGLAARRRRK